MKPYFYLFLSIFIFTSCSTEEEVIDYDSLNEVEIQDYISKNNLTPQKTDSGLYYVVNNEGTGTRPIESSIVNFKYKATFFRWNYF